MLGALAVDAFGPVEDEITVKASFFCITFILCALYLFAVLGSIGIQVVVGKEPLVFGLARVFQQIRGFIEEFIGAPYQVVHSLEQAYDIIGVHPEDFTERVYPKDLAA